MANYEESDWISIDAEEPGTKTRSSPPTSRQTPWSAKKRSFVVVACGLAVIRTFQMLWKIRRNYTEWDFCHYYTSAYAARLGINPYTTNLTDLANRWGLHTQIINRGGYPPTFILCFEPLTLLTPAAAFWVWILINLGLLAILLLWLSEGIARSDAWLAFLFAALALLYPPLHDHFRYAQSQIVISVLLLAMYSAGDELAGISLALATLLRIFPVVMIGYLLARRRWQALLYFALSMAVGGLLTVGIFGFRRSVSFARLIPFLTSSQWYQSPYNVSIEGIAANLGALLKPQRLPNLRVHGFDAAAVFLQFLIFGVTYHITSRCPKAREWDSRAFPIWVVATILIAPTAWPHYMVMLYVPFAMIVWNYLESRAKPRVANLAALAYIVMVIGSIASDLCIKLGLQRLPIGSAWNPVLLGGEMFGLSAFVSIVLCFAATYSLARVL